MTESEQQRFEVMLEDINGKLNLVLEGHDAIRREFREFNAQLDEVRKQQGLFMSLLKGSHDELKQDIQGVRTELKETREELSARIEAVGDKVDGHEARIAELERKVT